MANVSLMASAEIDEADVAGWMLDGDLSLWLLLAELASLGPDRLKGKLAVDLAAVLEDGSLPEGEMAAVRDLVERLSVLLATAKAEA